jgi:hypothetical protein
VIPTHLELHHVKPTLSSPPELGQQLSLLLFLEACSCRAVWVVVGKVRLSFILGVFQTHPQPSDTYSSINLKERRGSLL